MVWHTINIVCRTLFSDIPFFDILYKERDTLFSKAYDAKRMRILLIGRHTKIIVRHTIVNACCIRNKYGVLKRDTLFSKAYDAKRMRILLIGRRTKLFLRHTIVNACCIRNKYGVLKVPQVFCKDGWLNNSNKVRHTKYSAPIFFSHPVENYHTRHYSTAYIIRT
jgi:hypothetical protein